MKAGDKQPAVQLRCEGYQVQGLVLLCDQFST
jgi:hypothetical protein